MRDYKHFLFFSSSISDKNAELDLEESRHAIKVLRLSIGDRFQVTNGNGQILICELVAVTDSIARGSVLEKITIPPVKPSLHCFVGLPEKDSFESIVTDLTAMGVTAITPVISEHCQKNWWEHKWEKHEERLRSKMIAAMKQSLYPRMPALFQPQDISKIAGTISGPVLAADWDGVKISECDFDRSANINCFIGPPGGFSHHELTLFKEHKFHVVNIGTTRLRTELAAVVMCAKVC